MDWVQKTFYETRLLSWAMRFVEGGYALRYNGEQYIREQIDSLLSQTQTYPGRLMASDHGREPAGFFRKEKLKTAWDFGSVW